MAGPLDSCFRGKEAKISNGLQNGKWRTWITDHPSQNWKYFLNWLKYYREIATTIWLCTVLVTPRRRQVTNSSSAMTAHRPLSSVMRSNYITGMFIPWCCPSVIYGLPLWRLPSNSTVPCSMIFGRTMITFCDVCHVAGLKASDFQQARILTCCHTYSFVLCPLYDAIKHPGAAFVFKSLDSPLLFWSAVNV